MELDAWDRLRPIGYSQAVAQALAALGAAGEAVRVTEVHRDGVRVSDGAADHSARVLPALRRAEPVLAVGDWVLVERDAHGERWVSARMPPLNELARRDEHGGRQPLVCNVDTALLVMGLDGDFNLRRLERYLALVTPAGLWPVVVLTKADQCADAGARCEEVTARVGRRVDVLAVNALEASAVETLAPYLGSGQTLVLLGSSGAGKSTLTNTLLGTAAQATGAVRADDSRGRHTTTARSLHRLPGGACVIDTPGLRTLRLDTDEGGIAGAFDDIVRLAPACRFRDCRHETEPGCAVREALPPQRLKNFHKLRREAERDTMSALERKALVATWKARSKAGRARLKQKGQL